MCKRGERIGEIKTVKALKRSIRGKGNKRSKID